MSHFQARVPVMRSVGKYVVVGCLVAAFVVKNLPGPQTSADTTAFGLLVMVAIFVGLPWVVVDVIRHRRGNTRT